MKTTILILCAALTAVSVTFAAENKTQGKQPDNTATNVRDRGGTGLTAQDQGGSEADRNLAAKVRRAVTSDDKLSSYAKNVKIIARDGRVTLRGPVRSADEKTAIAKKAEEAAGGAHQVDNQLEIAPGGKMDSYDSGHSRERKNQ
jgi:osmotically-inducible protein OsmY